MIAVKAGHGKIRGSLSSVPTIRRATFSDRYLRYCHAFYTGLSQVCQWGVDAAEWSIRNLPGGGGTAVWK